MQRRNDATYATLITTVFLLLSLTWLGVKFTPQNQENQVIEASFFDTSI